MDRHLRGSTKYDSQTSCKSSISYLKKMDSEPIGTITPKRFSYPGSNEVVPCRIPAGDLSIPPQNSRRHEKRPQSWARRAKILRTSQKDRLPYERRPPSKNAYVVRHKLHTHARTPTVEHAWTFFSELSRSKDSISKTKRNESFTT
jgi:hypothetical protein